MTWLFSQTGTRSLVELATAYERKVLANSLTNFYSPWLASINSFNAPASTLISPLTCGLVKDPTQLALLSSAFRSNDAPLACFDPSVVFGLDIYLPTEECELNRIALIEDALASLSKLNKRYSSLFASVVKAVVPLKRLTKQRSKRAAFSTHCARGAIFIVAPEDDTWQTAELLKIDLVHELGHCCLMLYQTADQILKDPGVETYSGIRDTLRPAIMSFHAATALAFISEYLVASLSRSKCNVSFYARELSETLESLDKTIHGLENLQMTELGEELFLEIKQTAKASARILK